MIKLHPTKYLPINRPVNLQILLYFWTSVFQEQNASHIFNYSDDTHLYVEHLQNGNHVNAIGLLHFNHKRWPQRRASSAEYSDLIRLLENRKRSRLTATHLLSWAPKLAGWRKNSISVTAEGLNQMNIIPGKTNVQKQSEVARLAFTKKSRRLTVRNKEMGTTSYYRIEVQPPNRQISIQRDSEINKLIVNGFFRSGTTLIWRIFRDQNPKTRCFYEPLHPKIIPQLASLNKHTAHGVSLWNEYAEIHKNDPRFKILYSKAITPDGRQAINSDAVNYLTYLLNLDRNIVVQPNRASLILDKILLKNSKVKIVHIIRDPLEVWSSMQTMAETRGRLQPLKRIFPGWTYSRSFGLIGSIESINQISKTNNRSENNLKIPFRLLRTNNDIFEDFIYVWTLVNKAAVDIVNRHEGIVFPLKSLLNNDQIAKNISSYTGLNFSIDKSSLRKPKAKKDISIYKLDDTITTLKLQQEYKILDKILNSH